MAWVVAMRSRGRCRQLNRATGRLSGPCLLMLFTASHGMMHSRTCLGVWGIGRKLESFHPNKVELFQHFLSPGPGDARCLLQGVAATIVADPIVSPAPTNDDPLDGTPKLTRSVAGALQTMIDNTAKNKQLTQGLTDLCEAEIDGTKQMLAAGNVRCGS